MKERGIRITRYRQRVQIRSATSAGSPSVKSPCSPPERILLGLSPPTYGLSHIFECSARTISLVPAWLPLRPEWACLTGAGQIACGLGVLVGVYPRLAASAEAAMRSLFTLLVWVPAVVTKPAVTSNWGEFIFTAALAGAAWVVAGSILGPGSRK